MEIFGIKNLSGGLSNQKLAMLGLVLYAKEKGGLARFPSQMVDFVPRDRPVDAGRFFFHDLFDVSYFREQLKHCPISLELPTQVIPFADLLPLGFEGCMRANAGEFCANFMLSLRASKEIAGTSVQILNWLKDKSAFGLQLRIERDWRLYLESLSQQNRVSGEYNTTQHEVIFSRIRATKALDGFIHAWACCDEDDLSVSKEELKYSALKYDLVLLFKSDLPSHIKLPDQLLLRSMVDFSVCEELSAYVGLTRSTFSRTLFKAADWRGGLCSQFAYNLSSDALVMQHEYGVCR